MTRNLTVIRALFFLSLCSLTMFSARAQNFLINQNFSSSTGSTPPTGWTQDMLTGVSGLDAWQFGKAPKFYFAPPFDDNYAMFDSYNGGSAGGTATNGQAENVAIESPSINTTGVSNLYFSFDYMELYNGGTGYLDISTNGGSTWSPFASYTSVTSVPVNVLYNFSSYIGYTAFKFRFRWDNTANYTYSGYLAVDNVKLFERYATDVTITDLAPMYDKSCPSATQAVNVLLKNEGNSTVSNIPITVKVTGAVTATLNYTYTGSLGTTNTVNVNVGNINTTSGGTVNFTAFVSYSGDLYALNDTLKTSRVSASIAGNPTAIDGSACHRGSRVVIGATKSPGDSTFWYDQASGGTIIGMGNPFLTPPINGTTTFYAQNAKLFNNDQWAYQGPYRFNGIQYSGSYFNVNTINDILIDSFWQHFAYAGAYSVQIYYKTGTYAGFESNQSSWTLHETHTITSNGYGHMVGIKLTKPLNIPAGNLYGFYILVDGMATNKCITFKNAVLTYSNADLSVSAGTVSSGQFAGVTSGYSWDGRMFYRKLCLSGKVAVKAVIKPSPIGAALIAGSPFQGKFKTGDMSDPDLMQIGQTNTYELTPPTGYNNSGHMTTWKINFVSAQTPLGFVLPGSAYSYTTPSSSGNSVLTFQAPASYLDSTIIFTYSFSDLGPNFCDSTVRRVIRVVPTPFANFSFPSPICDGTPVVFSNKSTIHSGTLKYQWYFGDGDSSDNLEPVHTYAGPGSYFVKLTAISVPYGITKDTTIVVNIYEIPKVAFKPTNACEGQAVKFTNLTTVSSGTLTYDWDFGDNSAHSVANSPSHLYAVADGYKVTLTAMANGCSNQLSKNAYEFARPKAGFTAPVSSVCAGADIVFPNTSTISSGEAGSYWDFGDGVHSTIATGEHAYATQNTYNVKLKMVSEFGCADSVTKQVTIKPAPKVSFTTGKACSGTPSIFTNTTTYVSGQNPSYTWSFSDGGTATTTNVTHAWGSLGPKTIVLSAVQANGCTGSSTQNIEVLVQPLAKFQVADVCSGVNAIFENQTTIDQGDLTYLWDFGDNTTSTTSDPLHPYTVSATKTFNVVLIAGTSGGCDDTARQVITVSEIPLCGFTTKVDWPNGYRAIKFIPDNATYSSYVWYFGEGGSSTSASPVYTYLYDGNFRVTLKAKNAAGCECETEIRVPVGRNQGVGSIDIAGEVNIYPNPNNGMFTVSVDDAASSDDGVDIEVYNTLGERIYTIHSTAVSNLVNLGGAARGIYIIKIKSNGKTTTRKVSVN